MVSVRGLIVASTRMKEDIFEFRQNYYTPDGFSHVPISGRGLIT